MDFFIQKEIQRVLNIARLGLVIKYCFAFSNVLRTRCSNSSESNDSDSDSLILLQQYISVAVNFFQIPNGTENHWLVKTNHFILKTQYAKSIIKSLIHVDSQNIEAETSQFIKWSAIINSYVERRLKYFFLQFYTINVI